MNDLVLTFFFVGECLFLGNTKLDVGVQDMTSLDYCHFSLWPFLPEVRQVNCQWPVIWNRVEGQSTPPILSLSLRGVIWAISKGQFQHLLQESSKLIIIVFLRCR